MYLKCCMKCEYMDYEHVSRRSCYRMEAQHIICSVTGIDVCIMEIGRDKETRRKLIREVKMNGAFQPPENCPYIVEHTLNPSRSDYENTKKIPTLMF